jgi:hypothetical protein
MRRPPAPTIVTIAVFTTMTVVLWIFISVYSILIKKADVEVPQKLLEPIDPNLDQKILEEISKRTFITEDQTIPLTIEPIVTPQQISTSSAASRE